MTEPMSQRNRVVTPGPSQARKRVNDQLLKIKEEILDTEHEDNSDNELSFENSQTIRPQRFYADIDAQLDDLNREEYTKKVVQICHNDYAKLLDYRERLGERAQAHPNCPQTRLVNRRNSSTGTRGVKCANDCYVLYAFNHGVQIRDVLGVFTTATTTENELIIIKDDDEKHIISVELFGLLTKMQSDIVELKKRQARDSVVLDSVRSDVNTVLVLFRTMHGTLNSVLSRVGSLTT